METFKIELFPEVDVFLGLFINITNAPALKSDLKDLHCSFLNPSLVFGLDHILLATCRALQAEKTGLSKTNNLYLDVVYYLSGTSNIRDTLLKFGISESSQSLFLLTFNSEVFREVQGKITGNLTDISAHSSLLSQRTLETEFKLPQNSSNFQSLILSRVAIKDI